MLTIPALSLKLKGSRELPFDETKGPQVNPFEMLSAESAESVFAQFTPLEHAEAADWFAKVETKAEERAALFALSSAFKAVWLRGE